MKKDHKAIIVLLLVLFVGLWYTGYITIPQDISQRAVPGGPIDGAFRLDVNQKNCTLTQGQSGDFDGSCTYDLYVLDGADYIFVSSSGAKTASFTGSSNGWSLSAVQTGSGADGNYALFFSSTAGYPMLDEMVAANTHLVNTALGDGGKIVADPDDDGDEERGIWLQFKESEVSPDESEVFLFTARWLGIDSNCAEGGNPADNSNVDAVSSSVDRTIIWRIDISHDHEGIILKDMYVKINETDKSHCYVDKSDADRAENWLDKTSFTEETFSDHMRYYIVKDLTPEDNCILSRADGESGYVYLTITIHYLSGNSDGDDIGITLYLVWFSDAYGLGTSSTNDLVEDTI